MENHEVKEKEAWEELHWQRCPHTYHGEKFTKPDKGQNHESQQLIVKELK